MLSIHHVQPVRQQGYIRWYSAMMRAYYCLSLSALSFLAPLLGLTNIHPTELTVLGYVHQMVNHSQNFADPVMSVCINHVEVY